MKGMERIQLLPPPAPTPSTNKASSPDIEGTNPDGPLDLDALQVWISADDRALRAKFIEFDGDELTLLTSADLEVQIDKENLSPQAIALAKSLSL